MPIFLVSILGQSLISTTKLYITQHSNRLAVLLACD